MTTEIRAEPLDSGVRKGADAVPEIVSAKAQAEKASLTKVRALVDELEGDEAKRARTQKRAIIAGVAVFAAVFIAVTVNNRYVAPDDTRRACEAAAYEAAMERVVAQFKQEQPNANPRDILKFRENNRAAMRGEAVAACSAKP